MADASQILYDAIELDLENEELYFAYWCCDFWGKSIETVANGTELEKGNKIFSRWVDFIELLERNEKSEKTSEKEKKKKIRANPKTMYATKRGVFSFALDCFLKQKEHIQNDQSVAVSTKAELFLKIGICYKELGEYNKAIGYLQDANVILPSSSPIWAQVADCLALSGEEKQAKLHFREAFFFDAQKIELAFLESEMIQAVIKKAKTRNCTKSELLEWIPVYGELTYVFNIKHGLSSQAVTKLERDIADKEIAMKDPANSTQMLTPKLINMCFRIIDHYERSTDAGAAQKSLEYQWRIKGYSEEIYNLYTASRKV